ncbi:hypothetical protein ACHAWF_014806 [Thalassiosira exigua]
MCEDVEITESIVFESIQGKYVPKTTSTSFNGPSYSSDSQEVYHFQAGSVASCEAKGCVSCDVCDDGKSIALNCSNHEYFTFQTDCSGNFTGGGVVNLFVHSFDFGAIDLSSGPGTSPTELLDQHDTLNDHQTETETTTRAR